jgi:hypothetical protein
VGITEVRHEILGLVQHNIRHVSRAIVEKLPLLVKFTVLPPIVRQHWQIPEEMPGVG